MEVHSKYHLLMMDSIQISYGIFSLVIKLVILSIMSLNGYSILLFKKIEWNLPHMWLMGCLNPYELQKSRGCSFLKVFTYKNT